MRRRPKLGQNFLVDDAARHAIADALGDVSDRTVVEIGPGHGAITSILAGRCRRLVAVELDGELARELRLRLAASAPAGKAGGVQTVEIVEADILETDLAVLSAGDGARLAAGDGAVLSAGASGAGEAADVDVIGNLPYYITSDILLHLFRAARAGAVRRAVLMMQREVAVRVAAPAGGSEYGLLSATTQMHARVEMLFTLPPSAFLPPPEVHSSVVRLEFAPRFAELGVAPDGFDRFLKASFAQKRKTLGNNLRAAGYGSAALAAAWPAGVGAQARAESVGLEAMAELYRGLALQSGS
ncbi:MAG: 16S rRNA (adenine(1518)-N(6)/adenine(1519)-N(6))-dimethyltransferase RsmA [Acidobacteriota bacterium]|nr:16S rRNA (adenine(1518)-N(6)/adenine(1519)-N(6))-dimethyltransferase RsmA [Acidobacteriota bacterium]